MPQEPKDLLEYKTDHDLLIELRTEMRFLRQDIKDLKEGNEMRLIEAERKIGKLQDQIDALKLWRSMLIGAWTVCTVILIPVALTYFSHRE